MRKVVVGLGIVVVIFVIAAITLPGIVDVNQYRPQIESRLEERLGREVSLGQMSLSIYPLAFRVEQATIGEDAEFKTDRPFAQVSTLLVSPELWPLLRHEVQIRRLELRDPKLELVRNRNGAWNFSSLTSGKDGKPGRLSLDVLKIFNGEVVITDLQENSERIIYDHIDLIVDGFAPGKSFSVDAQAHMPGANEQTIAFKGKAGPIQSDGGFARTAFDGNLDLTSVSLEGFQRFAKVNALRNSDAVLTGSADLKSENGLLESRGRFKASAARIRGVEINYPIAIDYNIRTSFNDNTTHIEKADIKLGKTPVMLKGTVDASKTPASLKLTVQSSNASIAETARLTSAFGLAFDPKTDVAGKLNMNVQVEGPVSTVALNGHVSARDITIKGGELREPVHVNAIEFSLDPNWIRSNEFNANTGHTNVTAQFNLGDYRSQDPKIQLKLSTMNAEVGELLRIGQAYGVSAVRGMKGTGSVNLNVMANGPLKHSERMTYSGNGALRNVSIELSSMTKPVGIRNADLRFTANSAILDNLDVSLGQTAAQGNATIRNFTAPRLEFKLAANQINVREFESAFKPREERAKGNLLNDMTGGGHLTVNSIIYDQITLKDVNSTVTLDRGMISLKPLTSGLYGGRQSGSIVVNARSRPVTYTVDSTLKDVDANQFLSSISQLKETLYGLLGANADLRFVTTAGSSDIARSLNGQASLTLRDGKIAHMDLLHQLATIGKFQRTAQAMKPFTDLVQMSGDFDINNGVARTSNLKLTIPEGSVAAEGSIDLVGQNLNLRVTTVLSEEYSQAVGGPNIGGFMSTVFADKNGELVIPVIVTGNFKSPQFVPDLQKVAQMKLKNLVPSEIFREKPGSIFDRLLKKRP